MTNVTNFEQLMGENKDSFNWDNRGILVCKTQRHNIGYLERKCNPSTILGFAMKVIHSCSNINFIQIFNL